MLTAVNAYMLISSEPINKSPNSSGITVTCPPLSSETVCHLRCADLLDLETQRVLIDDVHTQKTQLTYENASRISGTLSLHNQEIGISDTYIKLNIRRAARYI